MQRYFIQFSYDGAAYHGWQIQPNARTVQQTLEEALATIVRTHIPLTGAGRTDSGVNATRMTAHADLPDNTDTTRLIYRLNRILPQDIAIQAIRPVRNDAHARFDAIARRYSYYVSTAKTPFARRYSCRISADTDFEAMNRAAAILKEYTDFTSFSKLHTDVKTNNCKITHAAWRQISPDHWVFEIEADRFLRNMVRAIVGTLLLVGRGKTDIEHFRHIIEQKERCAAGDSAIAEALFLTEVKYPEEIYL
ncbi:MAG: tRNA pseudouridine(38-40) synthase TruA [Bacteroidaceae bacterium]|nr:tRNA pseudouridine(38-40) synthase TruA [Bacteroidaceae bacterium]